MGLFGSNYERAGSGIAKNAPKKKGFFRFFECGQRRHIIRQKVLETV